MRLIPLPLLFCLALCAPCGVAASAPRKASGPGLTVEGETLVVVTRLPFKVVAPAGGKLYFWTLPSGWKHDAGTVSVKNVVTVSEAPEGSATVSAVAVDKDFVTAEYSLKVNVGKVTPPPPPPPPPDDPLLKALKAAYDADVGAGKAEHAAKLAALWRQAAALARQPSVATTAAWLKQVQDAGKLLVPASALVGVRRALADHLNARLPRTPDAPLTDATRELLASESLKVAAALEVLK